MKVLFHIPDDVAEKLSAGGDVERQALEGLALESYRVGMLTKAELRRLLGLRSRYALDGSSPTTSMMFTRWKTWSANAPPSNALAFEPRCGLSSPTLDR